ncbi:diacylglycerol/polyprenol kinase family protein [Limnoraphis robusta]|uniref:Phosphatidate cytidylyltransferase n=2 Tax=Limnoraphis robusta TaxID=1118279 RepID=A0A0F5Y9E8_9CYAN|nr:diacylglycerol/polyprenol kinase family protein [Limnoraphis robusta]KKD34840.1 phosphatidate cytidylyltransferase [Limnoraphis robusta CS-951]MEA5521997.1 SEC59/DGK1/VTE5 family protein [Limnoraphis robusta CCNP1315]MEA5545240.1 SEC59/DGK1/VTE5 family protein [Limnoraphis robusta CCNP1324]
MSILTESLNIWQQIALVAVWLGVILLLAEGLNRLMSVEAEVSRKVVHIGTGNVILLAWWLNIPAWIGISAGVISGIIALISYKFPILPSINSVGRKSLGTFFYAVSIGVLIGCFWPINQPQYAALGILVMTWGDGLAAVIGQNFGRHRYEIWGIQKSWEGSLTMCLVSYLVSSLILFTVQGNIWQTWVISVIVAVMATAMEAFSKLGIDNLTVPLSSAALAFFLNQYWPG